MEGETLVVSPFRPRLFRQASPRLLPAPSRLWGRVVEAAVVAWEVAEPAEVAVAAQAKDALALFVDFLDNLLYNSLLI